jgi:density-regulated protein DRP1
LRQSFCLNIWKKLTGDRMSSAENEKTSAEQLAEGDEKLIQEPKSKKEQKAPTIYCGICSLPLEYCEYMPCFEKCKDWLAEHHPSLYAELYLSKDNQNLELGEAQRNVVQTASSKRGGKAAVKDEAKIKEKIEAQRSSATITIRKYDRSKRKAMTIVKGLDEAGGVDLKKAAKRFAGKFACGAAVTEDTIKGGLEITIQGDVVVELRDFILQEYPNINSEQIHLLEK